jgi:subtilisin-like proprotein convertase family protein
VAYRTQRTTHEVRSGDLRIAVPDEGGGAVESAIDVAVDGLLRHLWVEVELRHPSAGDLVVGLRAPSGEHAVLRGQRHASGGQHVWRFDSGSHAELARLAEGQARGVWTLSVRDLVARESGVLVRWLLRFDVVPRS